MQLQVMVRIASDINQPQKNVLISCIEISTRLTAYLV